MRVEQQSKQNGAKILIDLRATGIQNEEPQNVNVGPQIIVFLLNLAGCFNPGYLWITTPSTLFV